MQQKLLVGPKINISDYTYNLPEDKVAKYPLDKRDLSKLIIYKDSGITQDNFYSIADYLPESSLMLFNNTKVVPARIIFQKESGALIEIFCLEPVSPVDYAQSFSSISSCRWRVIIGNAKRWRSGELFIETPDFKLSVMMVEKEESSYIVEFNWDGTFTFSEIIDKCGKIPIPPYLNRDSELIDNERYQTLYARYRGSVAAPTAGLHFTGDVLEAIEERGIVSDNLCLHVGAGTFVPVKSDSISDHTMHSEPFSITISLLKNILKHIEAGNKIIAVGTTTTRSLESLYYIGKKLLTGNIGEYPQDVSQWEPYSNDNEVDIFEAIKAIIEYMEREKRDTLNLRTSIIIVPSFKFRLTDILITNYHQPKSTLLLLIAAFIGDDWRRVYDYALENDFRFLSYGDSSLLFR